MDSKTHTFIEKLTEISIEIFIIVFAVSLSIWLHSWSEHNHQQNEVKKFLVDLKSDLIRDSDGYKKSLQSTEKNFINYRF
ncbi:MAG: hypothetical protein H7239_11315 [Flavobacterium sp.]|nr:hypothetical protein [Flavobacterium sp.]